MLLDTPEVISWSSHPRNNGADHVLDEYITFCKYLVGFSLMSDGIVGYSGIGAVN